MAAINIDLGGLQPFDCKGDATALAPRWKRWKSAFEYYSIGKGVANVAQKKALFLHSAGMDVQELFDTVPNPPIPGWHPPQPIPLNDYELAVLKLDSYFATKVNVPYERHIFRNLKQEDTETVDQYVTRLRKQSDNCMWDNSQEQIRDQVIDKCKSVSLRRKLLEKGTDLTLTRVMDIARSMEAVEIQVKKMGAGSANTSHEVYRVKEVNKQGASGPKKPGGRAKKRGSCYRCGSDSHYSIDSVCPAHESTCGKCNLVGHYAKCCRTGTAKKDYGGRKPEFKTTGQDRTTKPWEKPKSQVNLVKEEYAFTVSDGKGNGMVQVLLGGVPLKMLIDSGASTNIIDKGTWEKLKLERIKCKTQQCVKKLFAYGSKEPLELVGSFTANISVGEMEMDDEFVVIEGKGQPLLGRDTATRLGILKVGFGVNMVNEDIRLEFPECFNGVGKLRNYEAKLHIDETVQPVVQPLRRPPFSLRDKIETKLCELQEMGIIEAVEGPSPWVSALVVVPKGNGEVRLCVDMRQANAAVLRERYPIPTVEEVLQELNNSKVFTKLDLKWGYHQIELAEESREITTFMSHKGLFRYRRLMFGISSAPEKYQQIVQQVLQGIDGVRNISDDIVVYAETQEKHDKRVRQVMERLRERGLTLNYDKCQFSMSKLIFMGHVLSGKGVSIAEDKVKAVKGARAPKDQTEVRSFLGLVNYSARFIPNLATTTEPLRRLTRNGVPFVWDTEQKEAFEKLKGELSQAETLGYFDRHAETHVIADASPVGLGAVLVQRKDGEFQVICYASRSLSDVETRYSQTEKEALGLVWACEHFNMYLLGTKFVLITDHKPLEVLYGKKSKPSARIERWVLRLQSYDYTVQYKPGKTNIADSLSRLSCFPQKEPRRNIAEEYVRFVAQEAVPKAMTARQVEECSNNDAELVRIRECIQRGDWEDIKCSKYYPVRDELCTVGKLILRGTRMIIPQELRLKVIALAHEGHVGMSGTKLRLRTKVWWPGLDRDVEQYIRACHGCQLVARPEPPEPLGLTELPPGKWQDLAMDFVGPMPTGEYLFVLVDYYTRYYEVEMTMTTTTKKTINMLEKIFAAHGLPVSITSDNGPQFISGELAEYFKENGISQRRVTPRWAQANGEVERQNRSMLKAMKIAHGQGKNWRNELIRYVQAYRTTPHSTTGMPPAELLYGRKIRTKLPELRQMEINDEELRDRDWSRKVKGKIYADDKRGAGVSDLDLGDQVLVKEDRQNKLSTTFGSIPYEVVYRKGNSVVVESPQKVRYKRNITQVRKFVTPIIANESIGTEHDAGTDTDGGNLNVPVSAEEAEGALADESSSPVTNYPSTPCSHPQRERKAPRHLDDYVRY